ncbi:30S ribosomal protein S17e [Candidatus Woesearchaeota archaeon]|nr:30S ribosomal protein S17e [Candidatus Woesearchaeota archaeon]
MGRIKTQLIKRVSLELFDKYGDTFKPDFGLNSKTVSQFAVIRSKKVRNAIAGYITRLEKARSKHV